MSKRLSIEYVRTVFESEGYTLLSTDYVSNKQKLLVVCDKGHKIELRFNDFSNGHRCSICNGGTQIPIHIIKSSLEEEGYVFLSTGDGKVTYKCPVGHTRTVRVSSWNKGRRCSICRDLFRKGKTNPNWRGGKPGFMTYCDRLSFAENVRPMYDGNYVFLGVECASCGRVFIPSRQSVLSRIRALESCNKGDSKLYCSDLCKQSCSVYKQRKHHKIKKQRVSREVQYALKKLVLERDEYICVRCGSSRQLQCHHITGVTQNPIESADADNCVTLCKSCHYKVHESRGCTYNDFKCSEVKEI